jgi:virginiamycin B lyase
MYSRASTIALIVTIGITGVVGHDSGHSTPPAGVVIERQVPKVIYSPTFITSGPSDAMWFTEYHESLIGSLSQSGHTRIYPSPFGRNPIFGPGGITPGPGGDLWFTNIDANT